MGSEARQELTALSATVYTYRFAEVHEGRAVHSGRIVDASVSQAAQVRPGAHGAAEGLGSMLGSARGGCSRAREAADPQRMMGRGQAVRRGTLNPVFEGSNPSAPTTV